MSRPAVTAFRGTPPAGPDGAGGGSAPLPPMADAPPTPRRPEARLLHPLPARGMAFLALAVFGGLHWMRLLEPAEPGRAWSAIGAAVLVGAVLVAAARLRGWLRMAVAAGALVAGVALALLAAGAADEMLKPASWSELASGIARGADSLAGARVPYRGLDEWVRLTIALGGTLLLVLSAALAFWPRRSRRTGFPVAALVALVALYAVPAVALIFDGEFLRGALLALLVLAFLRLERLRRRDGAAAAAVAGVTVVAALMLAPALDGIEPWWDYETWAMSAAGSRSTTFDWSHDYGPLDWPRDGRELLRVKSKARSYWKADQLDVFDGDRWRQSRDTSGSHDALSLLMAGVETRNYRRWTSEIQVSVRNLRTETFVTAGTLDSAPRIPRRGAFPTSRAGIFQSSRTLRRGDVYKATVYIPQPEERELRNASHDYAAYELNRFVDVIVDPPETGGLTSRGPDQIRFDGFKAEPRVVSGGTVATPQQIFEDSRLRRTWALAQRLRANADSPYEYLQSIERFLSRGFGYSEKPPPGSETLDGFMFDTKVGYCQQFSGAMALLLRMGGVPARVATGFSPGSYARGTDEYVVRDYDAHSWVEVWFTGLGWVPFDPSPTSAPPRSQADDSASASAAIGDIRDLGTATYDPRRDGDAAAEPRPWGLYAGIAAGALVLLLALRAFVRRTRRRRPAAGLELERALRIVDGGADGVTLSALEDRFASFPPAAGYVRALRAQRYAAAGEGPTPAQRRGLRRALARGRGLGGRLRAWWALPPRLPHLR